MKIVTTQQMKAIESAAVDQGMTFAQLMENAGERAADIIRKVIKEPQATKCQIGRASCRERVCH